MCIFPLKARVVLDLAQNVTGNDTFIRSFVLDAAKLHFPGRYPVPRRSIAVTTVAFVKAAAMAELGRRRLAAEETAVSVDYDVILDPSTQENTANRFYEVVYQITTGEYPADSPAGCALLATVS